MARSASHASPNWPNLVLIAVASSAHNTEPEIVATMDLPIDSALSSGFKQPTNTTTTLGA